MWLRKVFSFFIIFYNITLKDLSENKLGISGAESVKDILLHNSNITRFAASGELIFITIQLLYCHNFVVEVKAKGQFYFINSRERLNFN